MDDVLSHEIGGTTPLPAHPPTALAMYLHRSPLTTALSLTASLQVYFDCCGEAHFAADIGHPPQAPFTNVNLVTGVGTRCGFVVTCPGSGCSIVVQRSLVGTRCTHCALIRSLCSHSLTARYLPCLNICRTCSALVVTCSVLWCRHPVDSCADAVQYHCLFDAGCVGVPPDANSHAAGIAPTLAQTKVGPSLAHC